jgi:hypothetical protein
MAARMRFLVSFEMRGWSRSASETVIADKPSLLPMSLIVTFFFKVAPVVLLARCEMGIDPLRAL